MTSRFQSTFDFSDQLDICDALFASCFLIVELKLLRFLFLIKVTLLFFYCSTIFLYCIFSDIFLLLNKFQRVFFLKWLWKYMYNNRDTLRIFVCLQHFARFKVASQNKSISHNLYGRRKVIRSLLCGCCCEKLFYGEKDYVRILPLPDRVSNISRISVNFFFHEKWLVRETRRNSIDPWTFPITRVFSPTLAVLLQA